MLLGTVPGELGQVTLLTQIRANAYFSVHATERSREDLRTFLQVKQLIPRAWLAGFYLHQTFPSQIVLANHARGSRKYTRYITLIKHVNAAWREEISRQVKDLTSPVSWEAIERVEYDYRDSKTGKDHFCLVGRAMDLHERSLLMYNKLKKGRFEEVLRKKMTAVESDLNLDVQASLDWLREGDRGEWIMRVAWVTAARAQSASAPLKARAIMPTHYFPALGISPEGVEDVEKWEFDSHEYDAHDDGLRKLSMLFCKRRWQDFVGVKFFLIMFDYYRNKQLFLLSASDKRFVLQALRGAARLEPMAATPPQLGKVYFCEGCFTFATPVVRPSPIQVGEPVATRKAVKALVERLKNKTKLSTEDLAFGTNATDGDVIGLRAAYFDPLDRRIYCQRSRAAKMKAAERMEQQAPPVEDEEELSGGDEGEEDEVVDPFQQLAENENVRPEQWAMRVFGTRAAASSVPTAPSSSAATPAPSSSSSSSSSSVPKKKKGKTTRDVASRTIMAQENFSCCRPLQEIDVVGAYFRVHGKIYARCVYCGRFCEACNANLTNRGMSCGKHPLVAEYPDYHRNWVHWGCTREEVRRALVPENAVPHPCWECQSVYDPTWISVHDFKGVRFKISLCPYHHYALGKLIPVGQLRKQRIAPSVRIDYVMKHLRPRYAAFSEIAGRLPQPVGVTDE
jgi:hypothetical protein